MSKQWVVHCDWVDTYFFDSEEDAIKEYESLKEHVMSEGHEPNISVYLFETKKVSTSVRDDLRMMVSSPREEGLDFDYWAKWDEKTFK